MASFLLRESLLIKKKNTAGLHINLTIKMLIVQG